jgi:hypothetical protein
MNLNKPLRTVYFPHISYWIFKRQTFFFEQTNQCDYPPQSLHGSWIGRYVFGLIIHHLYTPTYLTILKLDQLQNFPGNLNFSFKELLVKNGQDRLIHCP